MTDKTRITLGKRPSHIARVVTFEMADEAGHATQGRIEARYKYRTRKEFGAFLLDAAQQSGPAPTDIKEVMERSVETNAAYLEQILTGWDLDVPMTRASLEQLCDEMPGACLALMRSYREAIEEGRLGN